MKNFQKFYLSIFNLFWVGAIFGCNMNSMQNALPETDIEQNIALTDFKDVPLPETDIEQGIALTDFKDVPLTNVNIIKTNSEDDSEDDSDNGDNDNGTKTNTNININKSDINPINIDIDKGDINPINIDIDKDDINLVNTDSDNEEKEESLHEVTIGLGLSSKCDETKNKKKCKNTASMDNIIQLLSRAKGDQEINKITIRKLEIMKHYLKRASRFSKINSNGFLCKCFKCYDNCQYRFFCCVWCKREKNSCRLRKVTPRELFTKNKISDNFLPEYNIALWDFSLRKIYTKKLYFRTCISAAFILISQFLFPEYKTHTFIIGLIAIMIDIICNARHYYWPTYPLQDLQISKNVGSKTNIENAQDDKKQILIKKANDETDLISNYESLNNDDSDVKNVSDKKGYSNRRPFCPCWPKEKSEEDLPNMSYAVNKLRDRVNTEKNFKEKLSSVSLSNMN